MNISELKQAIAIIEALQGAQDAPAKPQSAATPLRWVVVATTTRDLWYGQASEVGASMTLLNARHIYYYAAHNSKDARGVGSLASHGPAAGSRVGAVVPSLFIASVAGVMECSEAAVKAFEATSWSE